MIDANLLRRIILKHDGAVAIRDEATTLVLGSSHGELGFDPRFYSRSYNLCTPSQDLKTASQLYEWAVKNLGNINHLILFYSAFSAGFETSRSRERWHFLANAFVFGLDSDIGRDEIVVCENVRRDISDLQLDKSCFGFIPWVNDDSVIANERATSHRRYSALAMPRCPQHQYISKIVDLAREKKTAFYVVIPPVRKDYRLAFADEAQMLFAPVKQLGKDLGFVVFDFFNDTSFRAKDFCDTDHMVGSGATKLTKKISRAVFLNRCKLFLLGRLPIVSPKN